MKYIIFVIASLFLCFACFSYVSRSSVRFAFGNEFDNHSPTGESLSNARGDQLIDLAIEQFEQVRTIDANVRLKVSLFSNDYIGNGVYLEKRNAESGRNTDSEFVKRLFLLLLKFQPSSTTFAGAESSTLKVVCDGKNVWKYSQIEGKKQLQRVEVDKLLEAITKSGHLRDMGDLCKLPSLGSLEGTLVELADHYSFAGGTVENVKIGNPSFEVWKLTASMKKEKLEKTLTALGDKNLDLEKEGTQLPTTVVLYLGKDDFFPYRIDYFNGPTERIDWSNPYIQQEYLKVAINDGDISYERFEFRPSGESVTLEERGTENYIEKLGL